MANAVNQDKLKKQLKELLKLQENRYCADCPIKGPTWASVNIGVFVCMPCSGIHRSLGVHITQVRSCDLDTWKPEWVEVMKEWGNEKANAMWEAKMPKHYDGKPSEADAQELTPKLQRFIRDKYERKKWYSKGGSAKNEEEEESDDEEDDSDSDRRARADKKHHHRDRHSAKSKSRHESSGSEQDEEESSSGEEERGRRRNHHHHRRDEKKTSHSEKNGTKSLRGAEEEPDLLTLGNEFESKFNPFDDVSFATAPAPSANAKPGAPSTTTSGTGGGIDLMSLYSTPAFSPQYPSSAPTFQQPPPPNYGYYAPAQGPPPGAQTNPFNQPFGNNNMMMMMRPSTTPNYGMAYTPTPSFGAQPYAPTTSGFAHQPPKPPQPAPQPQAKPPSSAYDPFANLF